MIASNDKRKHLFVSFFSKSSYNGPVIELRLSLSLKNMAPYNGEGTLVASAK